MRRDRTLLKLQPTLLLLLLLLLLLACFAP
jgi:hypothetical protein